jgi:hypothetical protein
MKKVKKRKPVNAPMVETDIRELGDQRLNPEEACAREREDLLRIEAKKKIWGQAELEDHERSAGPRMPWTELIRKLQRCNHGLQVRDGSANAVALYVRKKPHEFTDADRLGEVPPNGEFYMDHRYVSGFEKHEMPEYSHISLDTSMLPTREYRGWRTVLLALIQAEAITYPSAIREFGDPSGDKRSTRWLEQTRQFRQ